MTAELFLLISLLVFCLILSLAYSSSETSLTTLNKYKAKKTTKSRFLRSLLSSATNNPSRTISTILVGNNIVNIAASSLTTLIAIELYGLGGVAVFIASLTVFMIFFCEILPKNYALRNANRMAPMAALVVFLTYSLLKPIVYTIDSINSFIFRKIHAKDEWGVEEFRQLLLKNQGILNSSQLRLLLLSILDLSEKRVKDVMTPWNSVPKLVVDDTPETIPQKIHMLEDSLVTVVDTDGASVLGFVDVKKNHLSLMNIPSKSYFKRLIRPAHYLPESALLLNCLEKMIANKHPSMSLVVDEYGEIQGAISFHSIIFEITGDLHPESRENKVGFFNEYANVYVLKGNAQILDVNKRFGLELPTTGPKTLNGLILEELETLPEGNVCLQIENYRVETVHIDASRHSVQKAEISVHEDE